MSGFFETGDYSVRESLIFKSNTGNVMNLSKQNLYGGYAYHSYIKFLLIVLFLPMFLYSCDDQRMQTVTWIEYEPVYMSLEEFLEAAKLEGARNLQKPGKIYFYDGHLFINEVNQGVHIIDNRDPSAPFFVGFINIPANKDIAVRGNLLYADSHSDLLVFDIQDLNDAKLIARVENVFKFSANMTLGFPHQQVDHSRGIVVDWKPVVVEEVCEGNCSQFRNNGFLLHDNAVRFNTAGTGSSGAGESAPASGVGGSMARFAISGNYLYAVDDSNLITFDITMQEPAHINGINVGWAIETIFPYGESLFIGSAAAMYIFDISSPASPVKFSTYWHATACDPVVVEGDIAFVTLRDGELCPRGVNRLEVIDVKDLRKPEPIAFYDMINPHGLGIDNGYLFISEGKHGLKILDASDPKNVKQLRHIKDIQTLDVIPFDDVLMVTGESGIVQYDYSDINDIKHLSTIPVLKD